MLLDGIDELLRSHGAVEQRLESRNDGAGLHARGRVVDVIGGVAGLHQSFVGGQHLTQQLVVGARGLAFTYRRVAVVHCDLAGLVGLEEVQERRRGVLVLGVGWNTECGDGVRGRGTGVRLLARIGDPAGVVTEGVVDRCGVPAA